MENGIDFYVRRKIILQQKHWNI